jgi:hypothetical protein
MCAFSPVDTGLSLMRLRASCEHIRLSKKDNDQQRACFTHKCTQFQRYDGAAEVSAPDTGSGNEKGPREGRKLMVEQEWNDQRRRNGPFKRETLALARGSSFRVRLCPIAAA